MIGPEDGQSRQEDEGRTYLHRSFAVADRVSRREEFGRERGDHEIRIEGEDERAGLVGDLVVLVRAVVEKA